jgi:hypothetical protein
VNTIADEPEILEMDSLVRPHILVTRQQVHDLKAALERGDRDRCELYADGIRANARRWMEREVRIPARSGHVHRFCCTDGTTLAAPFATQEFLSDQYRCPACGKVYTGEPYDGGRRWYEHNWLARAARDLALAGVLEDDERFLRKAAAILLAYADAYPGPHTAILEGGMLYQSLCESVWIIPLAQAYDLVMAGGEVLSPEQQAAVVERLLRPCAQGLRQTPTGGNWHSWHLSAVGVVALAVHDRELLDWALSRFRHQMTTELGTDGLWPESVHTYHFYPLRAFTLFAEAAANSGLDLYGWQAPDGRGLEVMFRAPLGYAYPDTRLPAINDGWFESYLPLDAYEVAYHRYGGQEFAAALARVRAREQGLEGRSGFGGEGDSFVRLLLGSTPVRESAYHRQTSVDYPNLGIAVLRSTAEPQNVVTFDYGRFLGHGQLDKMGITLFARDRLLVADYGTPAYGSAILPYYTGTMSHNVVVVDGRNQERTRKGETTQWITDGRIQVTAAETDEAYPGVRWRRSVMLVDERVVVVDDLDAEEEHRFDWRLHAEGEWSVPEHMPAWEPVPGDDNGTGKEYEHLTPEVMVSGGKGHFLSCVWTQPDGVRLHLDLFASGALTGVGGACPAESGTRRVRFVIGRHSGTRVRFVAVLQPLAPGAAAVPLPRDADGSLRLGSETQELQLELQPFADIR